MTALKLNDAEILMFLNSGAVFYGLHRNVTSAKSHYLVVLNKNPSNDELIVVSVATSNIKYRKTLYDDFDKTCVTVKKDEYTHFTADETVFDCNDLKTIPIEEFLYQVRTEKWECKDNIPTEILYKLISAAKQSNIVKESLKKLL